MKISIITVTYNSEDFLEYCLKSVSLQKYDNIEHIIIDGGSNDNTMKILKSKNKQLTKIISEPDNGIYDAMNKGINFATGDIIGFLNSDDFYAHPEVLNNVTNIFKSNPSINSCYSDLVYIKKHNVSKTVRYWKSGKFILGSFSRGWCPPHPTFFARRSVYETFGKFDLKYKIASDNELMMRFLEVHKIKSFYSPEVWVKMRLGGITNNKFNNIWLQNKEIIEALKNHNLDYNIYRYIFFKSFLKLKQYF